ncbi:MAG: lysostaphin resistance A-like protein [Tepidisphaeraceae bacterium]
MSIDLFAGQTVLPQWLWTGALALGTTALAWRIGFFWRGTPAHSSPRLRAASPAALWAVALCGYLTAQLAPAVYLSLAHRQAATLPGATEPNIDLGGAETSALHLAYAAVGLTTLLICDRFVLTGGAGALGLSAAGLGSAARAAVAAALFAIPWTYFVTVLSQLTMNRWGGDVSAHELVRVMAENQTAPVRWLVLISAVIFAPLFEELLFRGHLQTSVRIALGTPWAAIAITSGLFALVHQSWWMMPPLFVLSACLGVLYERTGSLWAPIFMHAIFNGLVVAAQWSGLAGH